VGDAGVQEDGEGGVGAVKSMRQGADRVKEAHAQCLLQEFENFACKDGELVDDFAMQISTLAAELRVLGETMPENKVARKLLRSLPRHFSQIGVSIETLLDVNTMTIEDLVGLRIGSTSTPYESEPVVFCCLRKSGCPSIAIA